MIQTSMARPKKIKLPEWVYKTLKEYGNCALPNECNEMNVKELKKHLTEFYGSEITLRKCVFVDSDLHTYKRDKVSEYYVAEDRRCL